MLTHFDSQLEEDKQQLLKCILLSMMWYPLSSH